MIDTKKLFYQMLVVMIIILATQQVVAQVAKQDLIGRYDMNHDGQKGILVIEQKKDNCSDTPWCDLNLYYTDSNGQKHRAIIRDISKDWQHISFVILFPAQRHFFKGHVFSREKHIMAGTAMVRNERSGFYAKRNPKLNVDLTKVLTAENMKAEQEKKINLTAVPEKENNRVAKYTIDSEGNVVAYFRNGKKSIFKSGKTVIINPQKDTITLLFSNVPTLVPPLPDDPEFAQWIEMANNTLDQIVQNLLGKDEESFNNYKASLSGHSPIERINAAIEKISFMTE